MATLEITNFSGRLTRILNGDINSGFANFVQSFGYDPFSKPMNLTWFEAPTDISTGITDLFVAAKSRFDRTSGLQYIFGVGSSGRLYKIQVASATNANLDSVVAISSVNGTFTFGAGIEFFGNTEKLYLGSNTALIRTGTVSGQDFIFNGESTNVGTVANYVGNQFHQLKKFTGIGKLIFANGPSIGAVDSTGTVSSSVISVSSSLGNQYSELNPALPPRSTIQDLDMSPDGNYLLITASEISSEEVSSVGNDRQSASSSDGFIYKWNGIDAAITAVNSIPSFAVTALQTYLQNNIFFSNDSFGASINDGTNKILTLPGNKSPYPNSTTVNGNFLSWISPELISSDTALAASMYYFGSLDQENPPGLYRIMRYATTLASGFIYQTPVNILTNNRYLTVNNAVDAIITPGLGKHYFSTYEINNLNTSPSATTCKLYRFLITPTGTGTSQLGVYQTQTQLFSKRATIKQIRVYTEPTVANNGFQIDCIGSDGVIITNGTFNYTFVSGTDETNMQGALERINFNPTMANTYALGLRITNTGTANMTIKKVEIDFEQSGK